MRRGFNRAEGHCVALRVKTYTAIEIGQIYDISARDKAKYSSKEVPTSQYNEQSMREIGRHIGN